MLAIFYYKNNISQIMARKYVAYNSVMLQHIGEFYAASEKYVELFDMFVEKHGLVGRAKSDHICYKCDSNESYEAHRAMLENESDYVYQSFISGRRIAVIKLKKSISTSLGDIEYLELSDKKPNSPPKEGFDHIEAYPVGQTYDEMVEELSKSENVVKVERPHHTTHDIDIGDGFLFRCTQGPLVEKIKRDEMV